MNNHGKYRLMLLFIFMVSAIYGQQNSNRRLLLRDEGLSQLSYEDLSNPKAAWYSPVPPGRDIQLIGNGLLLIGTGKGYEQREIITGKKVSELISYEGTIAARRLRNGNTLLTGLNWQGKQGIVLLEVDRHGAVQHQTVYPGFNFVRLVRETNAGTFLITSNKVIFEGDRSGNILWKLELEGPETMNAWQALRVANGQTVVSTGYGSSIQLFGANGKLLNTITGPGTVNPHFFAGLQILSNGNFVVANWQAHGPGHGESGIQLLEYTPTGKLVWSWHQDHTKYSSLQGVIVLDGLDTNFLHVENESGVLSAVK